MAKPLKYGTPEELQAVIDAYFEKTPEEQYTGTGMAMMVGSKQLVQDYEKREGYKEIVKAAKLRIENSYELSLRKNSRSGDIFALKNYGWSDRTETELSGPGGKAIEISDLERSNRLLYLLELAKTRKKEA